MTIVFFDLDGTILDSHKRIPDSTYEAIKRLKAKGIVPAIATGRAPFHFTSIREKLDIHTFVSFNGQYVVHEGHVISTHPLPKTHIEALVTKAQEFHHPLAFLSATGMGANANNHPHILQSFKDLKEASPVYCPTYYKEHDVYQGLLFAKSGEADTYLNSLPYFDHIQWHPYSMDILPKGGSKAEGIQKVIDHLGLSRTDTIAFGDGLNDIEMLSFVNKGIAMENGHLEAKKVADHITTSSDDHGIMNGLNYLGLI
ncbi:Cof subfamily protein (haloacid dehalogenase superfamily) [Pullulanibacillus pueri]|uniref:Phosphatase n=1 Tax=Pullulanibacillus pueri TaxID=1437324 RepID=A0A8J3EJS5_9BACL|nr:Cof-type HAD-IIB family hydrolase [Pullulanibacillus pueri]MBM7680071.1 Cof subfamily protein (haloacid dehalogenase superfamily) [Pullulanibacillus pueri]GGH74229.1 phosphatase [Pullulanibacillus pueri]